MKKICVFCSSNTEINKHLLKVAKEVGIFLGKYFEEVIYGGSNRSLMGELANGVLEVNGKITAVITRHLHEIHGEKLGAQLIVVETMGERKSKMLELSDAFIALPGGFGTCDEIFEMLTLAQIGEHSKPCGFLNTNGYFDLLLAFLDHTVRQGGISRHHRPLAISADNIEDLMGKLKK